MKRSLLLAVALVAGGSVLAAPATRLSSAQAAGQRHLSSSLPRRIE